MALLLISWQFLLLLVTICAVLIKYVIDWLIKICHLPPGPWGLPLLGYLPWMNVKPYETFITIGKKYGGLFSVQLGGDTAVVLNDWPTIKATIVDHPKIFSGRPKSFIMEASTGYTSVGFGNGPVWQQQKKLTIQCLRNIGIGRKSIEIIVSEIVHQLIDKLTKLDNQVVPMSSMFFGPILKVNWGMISGDVVTTSNVKLEEFEEIVSEVMHGVSSTNLVGIFPWLRFFPPNGFGFRQFKKANEQFKKIIRELTEEHILRWKAGAEMDFIDHYVTGIKKHEEMNKSRSAPFNVENAVGTVWDLFLGGVDTTNSSCQWGLLYLASNPHVQKKAQEELDAVVGKQRLINADDFSSLFYLEALIKEITRISSIIHLAVPHAPTKDFEMNGYTIPKGVTCLPNVYGVNHDPALWGDPEVFRPERFIDCEGRVVTPPYWIPFSLGPRICVGKSLAELELKLVFGGLLQNFTFSLPKNTKANFEPKVGIILSPQPYSLLIQLRN